MHTEIITEENLEDALELGEALHEESRYIAFDFSLDKLRTFVTAAVHQPEYAGWIVYKSGMPVGIMAGFYSQFVFGGDRIAQDLLLYVLPAQRGRLAFMRLIQAYEQWAHDVGCSVVQIGVTTGIKTDRTVALLNKFGYSTVGVLTQKELKHVRRRFTPTTRSHAVTPSTN